MRLEKYLVLCGVESRKKIKKAILEGRVQINGKIERDDSKDIDESKDIITYDGFIPKRKELKYYIMYKIAGYITAMEDKNDKVIAELLPDFVDKKSVFPVGRLDRDTEGLLLFTNDGELNHLMSHPNYKMEKTYYIRLDREITLDGITQLESGVPLADTNHIALPGRVEFVSPKEINLTITEGRYHQVKKMIKSIGNKVVYLKRVRFGNLTLGDLNPGEVREIKKEDIM